MAVEDDDYTRDPDDDLVRAADLLQPPATTDRSEELAREVAAHHAARGEKRALAKQRQAREVYEILPRWTIPSLKDPEIVEALLALVRADDGLHRRWRRPVRRLR